MSAFFLFVCLPPAKFYLGFMFLLISFAKRNENNKTQISFESVPPDIDFVNRCAHFYIAASFGCVDLNSTHILLLAHTHTYTYINKQMCIIEIFCNEPVSSADCTTSTIASRSSPSR